MVFVLGLRWSCCAHATTCWIDCARLAVRPVSSVSAAWLSIIARFWRTLRMLIENPKERLWLAAGAVAGPASSILASSTSRLVRSTSTPTERPVWRASARTVVDTVALPIEQQVNGVENMLYMSSQSTGDGNLAITVTFKQGTDLNAAQVLVQNRVAIAVPQMPIR